MINNRFQLIKKLGEGRSKVFLCKDEYKSDKLFAIKIISNKLDDSELKSFFHEQALLQKISHPNIIKVYGKGEIFSISDSDSKFNIEIKDKYFLLDYFKGDTLSKLKLKDEQQLREIIRQLCSALYYLHQSNYIYLDLKLDNILFNVKDDSINIKLIDFGFAEHRFDINFSEPRGTKEYLAPELINKLPFDHRVDLYALGVLLFKLVYRVFPFVYANEVDLFKAHLTEKFIAPVSNYTFNLKFILEKLLQKDASQRFENSLQVLEHAEINFEEERNNFQLVTYPVLSKNVCEKIDGYLASEPEGKAFAISGSQGFGKSEYVNYYSTEYNNVVLIRPADNKLNGLSPKHLLNQIIYSPYIYDRIEKEIIIYSETHIKDYTDDSISQIKSIFIKISRLANFIVVIDDYDKFTDIDKELLTILFPIILSDSNHLIITVSGESRIPQNFNEIKLSPLNDKEVRQIINSSTLDSFPQREFLALLLKYTSGKPSEISEFFSNLIFLNRISFNNSGTELNQASLHDDELDNIYEEVFLRKLDKCGDSELNLLNVLSALSKSYNVSDIILFIEDSVANLKILLASLAEKEILKYGGGDSQIEFYSPSLKLYVRKKIKLYKEHCGSLADILEMQNAGCYNDELAYLYEESGSLVKSFFYYLDIAKSYFSLTAYRAAEKILNKIVAFDLPEAELSKAMLLHVKTLFSLAEFGECLQLCELLIAVDKTHVQSEMHEVRLIHAKCLVKMLETGKAKKILEELIEIDLPEQMMHEAMLELAGVELDNGRFEDSQKKCNSLLESKKLSSQLRGKIFNILALIEVHNRNNFSGAIEIFFSARKEFIKAKSQKDIASVEVNIGNIYNVQSDPEKAIIHWDKAININSSVGNLEQEAMILLNKGVLFYTSCQFEEAIASYKRALIIFRSINFNHGVGLAYSNLGEVFIEVLEFENAQYFLNRASEIFSESMEELIEIIFNKAKLYFRLNSKVDINELLLMHKKFDQNDERVRIAKLFLEQIFGYIENNQLDYKSNEELIEYFLANSELNSFMYTYEIRIENHLKESDFEGAHRFIKKYIHKVKINSFSYFISLYYLSIVSTKVERQDLLDESQYLSDCYDYIEKASITDFTIKVLSANSRYYLKRGNHKKSGKYFAYLNDIRNGLFNNIKGSDYLDKLKSHPLFKEIEKLSENFK